MEDVREQSARSQAISRQLEALVEASRSGIVLVDRSGRARVVNRAFRSMFALGNAQVVGAPIGLLEDVLRPMVAGGTLALGGIEKEDSRNLGERAWGPEAAHLPALLRGGAPARAARWSARWWSFDDVHQRPRGGPDEVRVHLDRVARAAHAAHQHQGIDGLGCSTARRSTTTRELVEVTKRNATGWSGW